MSKKNTTNTTAANTTATDKAAAEKAKKQAIADAIALLQAETARDIATTAASAGAILASLDGILSSLAEKVKKTDENAKLWALELVPVTVKVKDEVRQWVQVNGLDRNANIQIVDDGNGVCLVNVAAKKVKSAEQQAYYDAIVGGSKDLTVAVAVRKAVAGQTFRQVFAVAQRQERDRMQKKYENLAPTLSLVSSKPAAKLVKSNKTAKTA